MAGLDTPALTGHQMLPSLPFPMTGVTLGESAVLAEFPKRNSAEIFHPTNMPDSCGDKQHLVPEEMGLDSTAQHPLPMH